MNKKQLVIAGIVAAIGVAATGGIASTYALTNGGGQSDLVQQLSSKFNLKQDDVQKVFDEHRASRQAERTADVKTDLAKLVTDKKLTQEQMDNILAKREEIQKLRDANRTADQSLSRDDMREKMQAERTKLETWAKDNGIDSQYLRYVFGHGGGKHGGERGHGPRGEYRMQSQS